MNYVAVVIADAVVAWGQEINRNLNHQILKRPGMSTGQLNMLKARIAGKYKLRAVGTLHTVVALECPEEMDNCRNCGDPEEDCYGPNHCPSCGTLHGCAPDRIITQNGYKLIPLDGPIPDNQMWNAATESLVDR